MFFFFHCFHSFLFFLSYHLEGSQVCPLTRSRVHSRLVLLARKGELAHSLRKRQITGIWFFSWQWSYTYAAQFFLNLPRAYRWHTWGHCITLNSFKNSHFQNEAKCRNFVLKMSLICVTIKNHFYVNGFALGLALNQRLEATPKWPIEHFTATTRCHIPEI